MSQALRSDLILVGDVLRGDSSAWCILVYRHQDKLSRQVSRFLGDFLDRGPRDQTFRSIVKETFQDARQTLDSLGKKRFSSWLCTIAFGRVIRHLMASGEGGKRTQLEIITGVHRLLPDLQAVLALKDMEGLADLEVARILGQPVAVIPQRVRQARLELRSLLQEPR